MILLGYFGRINLDLTIGAARRPGTRPFGGGSQGPIARRCQAQARGLGYPLAPTSGNPAAPAWAGAVTRLPRGEGRPDDLPVADRQARTHRARARGRDAGAGGFDAGIKSTKKTEATGCLHSSLLNSGALKFIPDTRDQTGPAPTPARRCTGRRCGGACGCRHRAGSSSSAGISRPVPVQRPRPRREPRAGGRPRPGRDRRSGSDRT